MAFDWLAAVLPTSQMPGLKILVNEHRFYNGNFLVAQAPRRIVKNMFASMLKSALAHSCNLFTLTRDISF